MKDRLIQRLKEKTARIGIVGLGYVGLPLLLRYSAQGYAAYGLDIDQEKITALQAGQSYIEHIAASSIQAALDRGLVLSQDFSVVRSLDAIILCVPTPLTLYREPDLSFIIGTMESLIPYIQAGQIISLESTTYPGTTEEELIPRVEQQGLRVGQDIFLVFSPEREDPGNPHYPTHTIPKICGGATPACLEAGLALYQQVMDRVVPVSSLKTAELTKLLENIHRAVNIGLVNEMKIVADAMGIDIHEVIRAAATKPFGFVPYYPGPGLGGHCIPIDPFYLTWKARQYGVHTRFIELAGEINSSMPDYVIMKVSMALNARQKAIRGSRILVLGLAYKKNVDDIRESPAVILMEKLQSLGAEVAYSDPHIPVFPRMRSHAFALRSLPLNEETIRSYDALLLATDHDCFDYESILESASLIIDTRGRYRVAEEHVVSA